MSATHLPLFGKPNNKAGATPHCTASQNPVEPQEPGPERTACRHPHPQWGCLSHRSLDPAFCPLSPALWSHRVPTLSPTPSLEEFGPGSGEKPGEITFYVLVKAIYTLGYSVSLTSLTTGSIILCLFRKLHCTRNYIHLNLFLSFILRAISVLVKDDVLYSSSGTLHCPDQPSSWVGCKLSLVLFQYCIMANFYWLLVEGLYLHTLLVAIFSPSRRFVAYLLIGWGIPTVCIGAWTAARLSLEDTGCWDTNDHSVPWWVIRTPILISIIVNFVLFVSIIRILLQKLTTPDVGGNDQSQYKRLTKSTLLLIPLFGVHYMVFAVFPIGISSKYQILFELCLGSFQVRAGGLGPPPGLAAASDGLSHPQGLVVAVLYCFLNSEVSASSASEPRADVACVGHSPTWSESLGLLSVSPAVPCPQLSWPSSQGHAHSSRTILAQPPADPPAPCTGLLSTPSSGIAQSVRVPLRKAPHRVVRGTPPLCMGLVSLLDPCVQSELRRKWRSLCPSQPSGRDYRLHSSSLSRNGSESALQFHRGSCAPSALQTETSVI
ncbi:hypothetical protein HPG69_004344 [Diceros bicornis minor]|uniref:G-protein coupled receptors family 2 profile 2 domain-containing protein n=1 Tax=Diceros bicornis minor TaxID=77932 RepID=A0A7J7E6W9_DICBM|nr:hypothetical protein HPG69_004344 [Diceros bicornis minor]